MAFCYISVYNMNSQYILYSTMYFNNIIPSNRNDTFDKKYDKSISDVPDT